MVSSFKQVVVQGNAISARANHRSIAYKNNLYVLMGNNGTGYDGDMYWTQNGYRWARRSSLRDTLGNTISARESFGLCEHNEKVYFMGGFNGSTYFNEVYVTSDMNNWKRLQNAGWTGRSKFGVYSFDGRLWVIGGTNAGGILREVWWTRDGVSWTQEANPPWAARRDFGAVVYHNKMYVIGGLGLGVRYNEVWYSSDGRNWTRLESNANFTARDYPAVAVFGDNRVQPRLVLTGGQTGGSTYSNEIWHSGNGNEWEQGPTMPMGELHGHSMNYFDARLFVVGGVNAGSTYMNEVWEANNQLFGAK
jgi:hypothetical protein